IPGGATINSVSFLGNIDVSDAEGTMILDFGVYGGNGVIELSDATASSTIAGSLTVVGSTWSGHPGVTVSLDVNLIQAAVATAGYVGLNLWIDPSSTMTGLGLNSLENPNSGRKPTLSITYTPIPEPASCIWIGFGIAAASLRSRK